MSSRPLLTGEPETEIGTVTWDGATLTLDGAAEAVFASLRELMGDESLGRNLIADGWSNGYVWLGPSVDDDSVPVEVNDGGGQSEAGE